MIYTSKQSEVKLFSFVGKDSCQKENFNVKRIVVINQRVEKGTRFVLVLNQTNHIKYFLIEIKPKANRFICLISKLNQNQTS